MEQRINARRWTFAQCMWACPARKLTTITDVLDQETMNEFVARKCVHKKHDAALCGVDESGLFRTRIAQAYPQPMCKQLALAHVRWATRKGPMNGTASISSRLVLDAISQFRAERQHALQAGAPLPPSFQLASG